MRVKRKDMVAVITDATDESMTRMEAFKATMATGKLDISWEIFKRIWQEMRCHSD
jgi:hypothetical protein|tara:strand:- start:1446 stop:1610 length:165 start_codon:yes stop_codon:yes gene_type:complete